MSASKCPVIETAAFDADESPPVIVNAVVPLLPLVPATVTAVKPAIVVEEAPKDIAVEPIVTALLESLALAILPASIVLVTVVVSPVVIIG